VVVCLYILSALGRLVSGVTVAYAGMLPGISLTYIATGIYYLFWYLEQKKLDKCLKVRNLLREWKVETYFLKKLSLTSCLIVLCVVCGAAIMWIGVVWIPEGLQVVF
jgi:hypothetical protein